MLIMRSVMMVTSRMVMDVLIYVLSKKVMFVQVLEMIMKEKLAGVMNNTMMMEVIYAWLVIKPVMVAQVLMILTV